MNRKIKIVLTMFGLCFAGAGNIFAQQNIQFTQYIFNSLSVNPAYAGYKEQWFAQLGLRNQWLGVEDAPKTGQFSIDGVTGGLRKNIGVGLQFTADQLGAQSSNSVYANLAYRLQLDDIDTRRLSFGIGFGVTQYGLDGAKLRAVNPADVELSTSNLNNLIPDVRAGVYYYAPKWYAGLSVMDLFSASGDNNFFRWRDGNVQSIRRKKHLYFMTGFIFDVDEQLKIKPSVLFKEDFKGPTITDFNVMAIFNKRLWLGASYRTNFKLWKNYSSEELLYNSNAIAGIAQFYITRQLRIGYSYDYGLSSIASVMREAHEITIGFALPQNSRVMSPRFF